MHIILLQSRLPDEEIRELIDEFPHFLFLAPSEISYKQLGKEEWARVEVIFGNRLNREDLAKAHQLRWIHSPLPNLNPLCLDEIEKEGNIIVTATREENFSQIGEYVIGGVLAYAKNLFHWEAADRNLVIVWDSKWRDSMWTLKGRVFIQVGLGKVGTEIARRAKLMEMTVWGVHTRQSFHPHCHKVFSTEELHSILPLGDVVCLAPPRSQQRGILLKKEELELMKGDTILVIIGARSIVDELALEEISKTGRFRGILLDAFYQIPIPPSSPLWKIPNIIITPEVAPRPKSEEKEAFQLFRHNLRQYVHGNFSDMRNIVGTKITFTT